MQLPPDELKLHVLFNPRLVITCFSQVGPQVTGNVFETLVFGCTKVCINVTS